jgi:hypothetical protein
MSLGQLLLTGVPGPVLDADTAARFIFVNDQLVQSDTHNLPEGVICESFTDALIKHPEVVQQHFMQREAALTRGEKGSFSCR